MTQLDLFQTTRRMSRRSNPETSRKAAGAIIPQLSKLHEQVLAVFQREGALTDEELEKQPEFWTCSPSTVRKRRSELFQMGKLVACGERMNARGSATMTVWRLKV